MAFLPLHRSPRACARMPPGSTDVGRSGSTRPARSDRRPDVTDPGDRGSLMPGSSCRRERPPRAPGEDPSCEQRARKLTGSAVIVAACLAAGAGAGAGRGGAPSGCWCSATPTAGAGVPIEGGVPTTRYPAEDRWPEVMQAELGSGYEVVVDALSGRTTDVDDPTAPDGWRGAERGRVPAGGDRGAPAARPRGDHARHQRYQGAVRAHAVPHRAGGRASRGDRAVERRHVRGRLVTTTMPRRCCWSRRRRWGRRPCSRRCSRATSAWPGPRAWHLYRPRFVRHLIASMRPAGRGPSGRVGTGRASGARAVRSASARCRPVGTRGGPTSAPRRSGRSGPRGGSPSGCG